MKIDREALKSAICSTLSSIGIAAVPSMSAEEKAKLDEERRAAREARFAKMVEVVKLSKVPVKGKLYKISASARLQKALTLVKNDIALPEEFLKSADWAKAIDTLKTLATVTGIEESKMLTAFGCTTVEAVAPVAPPAPPVVEAAPVVVVSAPSKGNVVGIRSAKKGNKKTA